MGYRSTKEAAVSSGCRLHAQEPCERRSHLTEVRLLSTGLTQSKTSLRPREEPSSLPRSHSSLDARTWEGRGLRGTCGKPAQRRGRSRGGACPLRLTQEFTLTTLHPQGHSQAETQSGFKVAGSGTGGIRRIGGQTASPLTFLSQVTFPSSDNFPFPADFSLPFPR